MVGMPYYRRQGTVVDVYQNRDALGPAFLRASHSTADWTWLSIEVRV